MYDSEEKELWPPDDEWVPFPLPWAEGRCIPEKRMSLKDGEWIIEYRYPKPSKKTDDEDDEPEIDMIPVVRCKDCKWRGTNACFCKARDDVQDDWFCSEGERKGGR